MSEPISELSLRNLARSLRLNWAVWGLGLAAWIALAADVPRSSRGDEAPSASSLPAIVVADCLTQFPHRRRLASERPGILAQVPDEGDRFAPGSVVARLRDDVPRTTLAVAEEQASSDAEIKSAKKAHELAAFSLDKIQKANARNPGAFDLDVVQQRELEESTKALEVEVAQHKFDVAQLEVEQHRAELASYQIKTDLGGVVTRVVKKNGEGVQTAEEVLEIVDTSVVRVEGYADAGALALLKPGLEVEVLVSLPTPQGGTQEARFHGTLGFVDVTLTSGQEVRVWADVANPEGLIREGMVAELRILPGDVNLSPRARERSEP